MEIKKLRRIVPKILSIYCMLHAGIVFGQEEMVLPGTKTPYHPQQKNYTAPTPGYKPVFINYVGRHGARFLTKEGSDKEVLNVLIQADSAGYLSPMGKRILEMTVRLHEIEKRNYENISASGKKEQHGIGERMRKSYSDVFDGRDILVQYTKKIRTQQSAEAFLQAFSGYSGKIEYNNEITKQDDILRFYDESPAYQEYKKNKLLLARLDSLETNPETANAVRNVCNRIFTNEFSRKLEKGIPVNKSAGGETITARDFVNSLYELYGAQFSISGEMKEKGYTDDSVNLSFAFSESDLEWFAFKDGAADFFEKGPADNVNGVQVTIAVPLLIDFIKKMDAFIASPMKEAACLRFSHAEAISPFASLLEIPAASVPSSSVFKYADRWKAASIIPMSANEQWILYTNGKDHLLKVLLNEKEVALPVRTSTFPYYQWKAVKKYYLQKLKGLHADLNTDLHQFLLTIK